jgi:hypothetical protein
MINKIYLSYYSRTSSLTHIIRKFTFKSLWLESRADPFHWADFKPWIRRDYNSCFLILNHIMPHEWLNLFLYSIYLASITLSFLLCWVLKITLSSGSHFLPFIYSSANRNPICLSPTLLKLLWQRITTLKLLNPPDIFGRVFTLDNFATLAFFKLLKINILYLYHSYLVLIFPLFTDWFFLVEMFHYCLNFNFFLFHIPEYRESQELHFLLRF